MAALVLLGAVWMLGALTAAIVVGHGIRLADACTPFCTCDDAEGAAHKPRPVAVP